jgi:hypothetical protein
MRRKREPGAERRQPAGQRQRKSTDKKKCSEVIVKTRIGIIIDDPKCVHKYFYWKNMTSTNDEKEHVRGSHYSTASHARDKHHVEIVSGPLLSYYAGDI